MEQLRKLLLKNWHIVFVLLLAIFLRFYRLNEFAIFLSDQGRDAIIVKRIVTLAHFPAIGAASSVGQIYLGPFYYYLISPFLPIFGFNPLGLAFGVAFLSIIGMIALYKIIRKEIDPKIAFFFLVLIAFSSINIEASRFSWNPNLLPFFSFLTLYFFTKFIQTKRILFSILFGAFFSFSLQLHHLSALLIIPLFIFFSIECLKNKNKISLIGKSIFSILSFLLFSIPLVIFDLRHNFLNTKNFIKLFTEQGMFSRVSVITKFDQTIQSFVSYTVSSNINSIIALLLLIAVFTVFFILMKKNPNRLLGINAVNCISYLFFFSLLTSPRHPHYYHTIYFSFFLIAAFILAYFAKKPGLSIASISVTVFLVSYIILNIQRCYFLFQTPNNQIAKSKKVAEFLVDKVGDRPFNIATWPVEFFEDSYLYFMELKGIIPADRSKVEITKQMFVLCSQEPCKIIDSPSWNISMFGKAKIDTIWDVEGIRIYKLIHI